MQTVPTSLAAVTEYFPPSLGLADLMRRLCRSPSTFSTQTALPARTVLSLLQVTGKYNQRKTEKFKNRLKGSLLKPVIFKRRVWNHKHVVAEDYAQHKGLEHSRVYLTIGQGTEKGKV